MHIHTHTCTHIQGLVGSRGSIGPTGPDGDHGPVGQKGRPGLDGSKGAKVTSSCPYIESSSPFFMVLLWKPSIPDL